LILDFLVPLVIYTVTRFPFGRVTTMRNASVSRVLLVLLIGSAVAVTTACPFSAFSQEEATVRVLNISASGRRAELTDERLAELALDGPESSSRLYPELETLTFHNGDEAAVYAPGMSLSTGLVDISGALNPEGGFNFTSVSVSDLPGKSDLVIVGFDGSVKRFDEEVTIEYDDFTVTTSRPILLLPGDVMFLFVRETKKMYVEDVTPPQGCG
jgi:hypothetical protein